MFTKIRTKVMNINYKKTAIRFIIISISLMLVCTVATTVSYSKQINEIISYHQTKETEEDNLLYDEQEENENYEREQDHDYKHGKENDKEAFIKNNMTKPSLLSEILTDVTGAVFVLSFIYYWIFTALWLYRSAENADKNGMLWFVLGLIGNIVTVLVFLIVRNSMNVCPECKTYQKGGVYCKFCGKRLPYVCVKCGEIINREDKYCRGCGEKVIIIK